MATEQWRVYEIDLTTSVLYSNPYYDVQVKAVFRGPNEEVIERPAYWYRDSTWKVRFAPTAMGVWTYETYCDDSENSDFDTAGQEECVAYTGDKDIYNHGFIQSEEGKIYLEYADGTPFFWLGDTHWYFANLERLDESNKEGFDSQFKGMIDKRTEQGYTVYQCNLNITDSASGGVYFLEDHYFTQIDPDFFINVLDPKMEYIAESGLVPALGYCWNQVIDDHEDDVRQLAAYLVARYGAYPMIWTLGGEIPGTDESTIDNYLEVWRNVALQIQSDDAYNHPQSVHFAPLSYYYQDEEWLDFTMIQLGHGDKDTSVDFYYRYREENPTKPMVMAEILYENLFSAHYDARRYNNDTIVRQAGYRAIQAGCCGFTYGAQGIWNARWSLDTVDTDTREGDVFGRGSWVEGIDLPGGQQMSYLKQFYDSIPWYELQPGNEVHDYDNAMFESNVVITKNSDQSIVIVYIPDVAGLALGLGKGEFTGFPEGDYRTVFYNPRTGEYSNELVETADSTGILAFPDFPEMDEPSQDFILLIVKVE